VQERKKGNGKNRKNEQASFFVCELNNFFPNYPFALFCSELGQNA
jgi:hypothetical protein